MPSKRQAPESWDEVRSAGQGRSHKSSRLDTGDSFSTMDDPYLGFTESQELLDDAVMEDLLAEVDNAVEVPPLSVLRDFQSVSSNTENFDPRLKFSPVKEGEDESPIPGNEPPSEDINWDDLIDLKGQTQTEVSPYASPDAPNALQSSSIQHSSPLTAWTSPGTMDVAHDFSGMRLKPLKTFFRLSEMLEAKISTFKHSHDTVFELFARVIYSSRENFGHIQYFQFRDLFEETPPFLSGALSG